MFSIHSPLPPPTPPPPPTRPQLKHPPLPPPPPTAGHTFEIPYNTWYAAPNFITKTRFDLSGFRYINDPSVMQSCVQVNPHPKPQTPNPKPQTPNPKPQTPNPNARAQSGSGFQGLILGDVLFRTHVVRVIGGGGTMMMMMLLLMMMMMMITIIINVHR